MAYLIYKINTGKIESVRDDSDAFCCDSVITCVYGQKGISKFAAIEWDGEFPVGKIVVDGAVVDDPSYVPPPPPPPVVEPTPPV